MTIASTQFRVPAHLFDVPTIHSIGYEPLGEAWICDQHGVPYCEQTEHCRSLPWPDQMDTRLWPFMEWADACFRIAIAPYDRGEVMDIPDNAFDAYFVDEWLRGMAEVTVTPSAG